MRLQLTFAAAALAAAMAGSLLAAAPASATTQASQRVTVFREPSENSQGVLVIHPQTNVSAALGSVFNLNAAYDVDIVSGATPATFGLTSGVDAVSGPTKFSDTRHQIRGGFSFERPTSGIAFSYAQGWESDYKTKAISGLTRSDLFDHNFTLALGYTHNFDDVCDANNSMVAGQPLQLVPLTTSAHCFTSEMDVATHRLHIDTFEPALTWTMTPRLVVQTGANIQVLDGFQSNPYRSVRVGPAGRSPQEHLPQYRQRYALFGRAAYAFPELRASSLMMLRLYRDSWAVQAATAEMQLNKYVGQSLLFGLRGRYHIQQEAAFYRNALDYRNLGPAGQYWTGDRELSPMSNYLVGAKLALLRRPEQERSSWYTEIELDVKAELLVYRLGPYAPNADRNFANIIQAALSVKF